MKNSDLDFDGKQDLLLLTDTGKILTAGATVIPAGEVIHSWLVTSAGCPLYAGPVQ